MKCCVCVWYMCVTSGLTASPFPVYENLSGCGFGSVPDPPPPPLELVSRLFCAVQMSGGLFSSFVPRVRQQDVSFIDVAPLPSVLFKCKMCVMLCG